MARVPAWALGKIIWGDKILQASAFADDPNPHVNPIAGDIDYNGLQADYVSKTDASAQTITNALTAAGVGVSTHAQNMGSWTATSSGGTITSTTYTSLGVPMTGAWGASGFPSPVRSALLLLAGQLYLSAGSTGTYDIKFSDDTQVLSNIFTGFNNTNIAPVSLLMILAKTASGWVTGNHTYNVYAEVSDATTTLNYNITAAVIINKSGSPISGT